MMNDTVREELETKITPTAEVTRTPSGRLTVDSPPSAAPQPVIEPPPPRQTAAAPKPLGARFDTSDLRTKKTSPTLVEFQTKKATVPEWRLQLQNSVRQKVGPDRRETSVQETPSVSPKSKKTNGANALKVEYVEDERPRHQNPRVANALKRIEESRRTFSNQPVPEQSVHVGKAAPASRSYPFNVVARSPEPKKPAKPTVNPSPKPMLVSPMKIEKRGFDTNKLPPLETPSRVSSSLEVPAAKPEKIEADLREPIKLTVDENALEHETFDVETEETDEIEDLAPLSMRFNAGLFDMIIGVFATLILLSPFLLSGGTWISLPGFLALAAAFSIVMFLYLTISIAFVGRSFGMRLFSLELVDVEENAYPTLHQAAVSSSVYLLSMALAGVGFLPIFFNEERRAAHDILSGTILVREY